MISSIKSTILHHQSSTTTFPSINVTISGVEDCNEELTLRISDEGGAINNLTSESKNWAFINEKNSSLKTDSIISKMSEIEELNEEKNNARVVPREFNPYT